MNFYEENLELIKNKIPRLYNTIVGEKSIFKLDFEAIDGTYNYLVRKEGKKCYLHSLFDINEEMKQMFKNVDENITTLIVYGLGCGHSLHYLKENYKYIKNIFVIEPSLDMFKIAINNYELYAEIAQYDNVTFVINKDSKIATQYLLGYIQENGAKAIGTCFSISYRTLFDGYFEKVNESIVNYIKKIRINMGTSIYFREQWIENPLINLKEEGVLINRLMGEFNGKSAILISAGPSLNRNIHLLEAAKNKALIVTVGTASKLLDNKNIEPDFRFAMDGSPLEGEIFKNHIEDNSTLVFSDRVFPPILSMFKRKLRMVLDVDYITSYIYSKASIKYEPIKSGFSIANTTLDVLIKLGFKNIIFMGQDLCYTENKMYAEGSYLENDEISGDKNNHKKTKDIYGNLVYTDDIFIGMKILMEEAIEASSGINFINASEGGIGIKGTKIKTFQKVLEEDLTESFDYDKFMNDFYKENKNEIYLSQITKVICEIEEDMTKINFINEKKLKLLKKINRYLNNNMGIGKIKEELVYVESLELELRNVDFYSEYIISSMEELFKIFNIKYNYEGEDIRESISNQIMKNENICFEIKRQMNFIRKCIEEFKKS